MSSFADDAKDGNGSELEKSENIGPMFSSFHSMSSKIIKKIIMINSP